MGNAVHSVIQHLISALLVNISVAVHLIVGCFRPK